MALLPASSEPLDEARPRVRCGVWLAALLWVALVAMYFGIARFLGHVATEESAPPAAAPR